MLKETVSTAGRGNLLKKSDCRRASVDATVQEEAITYPTDAEPAELMAMAECLLKQQGNSRNKPYPKLFINFSICRHDFSTQFLLYRSQQLIVIERSAPESVGFGQMVERLVESGLELQFPIEKKHGYSA